MHDKESPKEERINLAYYSSDYAVNVEFDTYGLTQIESYIVEKYFVKKNAKVLDVGCGRGRTTVPLKEAGFDVIGIDISEEMIRAAKHKFDDIDFRVMNACDLKFENETFDYVLFSFNGLDVIYPEAKRLLALREIYRVLKKDGFFIFSSHNHWWLGLPLSSLPYFLLTFVPLNLFNLRLFRKYQLDRLKRGEILVLYHINPLSQRRQLRDSGFRTIETVGVYNKFKPIQYFESYLHYVAKKDIL